MSIIINGGYFLVNREGFVGTLKMPHPLKQDLQEWFYLQKPVSRLAYKNK